MPKDRDVVMMTSNESPSLAEASKMASEKYAVIIGIDEYTDERISNLSMATADAKAIYDVLTDPVYGQFPPENVRLLLNHDASYRNIKEAIVVDLANKASEQDTVVIYYAGHGAPAPKQGVKSVDAMEKYFVPFDAHIDRLRAHGIAMSDLQNWFDCICSKRFMIIIDSCYSGAAGGRSFSDPSIRTRSVLSDEFLEHISGEGRAVISACDVNQVSLELPELGHGLFTHYLIKGLQGEADTNNDGRVGLDELYQWVFHKVTQHSRRLGSLMEPIKKGDVKGDMYLTHYESPMEAETRTLIKASTLAIELGNFDEAEKLIYEFSPSKEADEMSDKLFDARRQYEQKEFAALGIMASLGPNGILEQQNYDAVMTLLKAGTLQGEQNPSADTLAKKKIIVEMLTGSEPTLDVWIPTFESVLGFEEYVDPDVRKRWNENKRHD